MPNQECRWEKSCLQNLEAKKLRELRAKSKSCRFVATIYRFNASTDHTLFITLHDVTIHDSRCNDVTA
jgi:hypothetical protein